VRTNRARIGPAPLMRSAGIAMIGRTPVPLYRRVQMERPVTKPESG
jgi:hypothetical protein